MGSPAGRPGVPCWPTCLVGMHKGDALSQQDGPQQGEAAKQGGQGDGLGEGQARRIVHLRGGAAMRS